MRRLPLAFLKALTIVLLGLFGTVAGSIAATHTFGAAHRYLAQMVAFRKQ